MLTRDEDALMFREHLGVVPVDRMLGHSPKGPRMVKSVDDRGRGAPMARRDEGEYCGI